MRQRYSLVLCGTVRVCACSHARTHTHTRIPIPLLKNNIVFIFSIFKKIILPWLIFSTVCSADWSPYVYILSLNVSILHNCKFISSPLLCLPWPWLSPLYFPEFSISIDSTNKWDYAVFFLCLFFFMWPLSLCKLLQYGKMISVLKAE